LIWINRPSLKESAKAKVGQTKFYCGRKNMYGLNMQAVCDHHGRFLDVSIMYGGSSSDLLAFERSDLYKQLHHESRLAPGLCLFGDNAYVNTPYMATPYPGTSISQEKDAYNFYHSQLRIMIECAFGRFVYRFAILQKKAPQQFSIQKIISMVICLCKLHNFCTTKSLIARGSLDPPEPDETDAAAQQENGGVQLDTVYRPETGQTTMVPTLLINHGHHNEGTSQHFQRAHQDLINAGINVPLPREVICAFVARQHLLRPAHRNRNTG
jgi:hypothetical protein